MVAVPQEFLRFSESFYSGSVQWPPIGDEWLSERIAELNAEQRKVIKHYLDQLLASRVSDQNLQDIWMSGGPSYGVGRNQYRAFFVLLRSKFEE